IVLDSSIRSAAGDFLDNNQNAGLDRLRDVTMGPTVSVVVNSSNTPIAIPAGTESSPSIITSPITVSDSFVVQPVELQLNITYPNDPDLEAFLQFVPNNGDPPTQITLFSRVGNTGTRHDFTNTVFGDANPDGTQPTPITNGGPPFLGRFQP